MRDADRHLSRYAAMSEADKLEYRRRHNVIESRSYAQVRLVGLFVFCFFVVLVGMALLDLSLVWWWKWMVGWLVVVQTQNKAFDHPMLPGFLQPRRFWYDPICDSCHLRVPALFPLPPVAFGRFVSTATASRFVDGSILCRRKGVRWSRIRPITSCGCVIPVLCSGSVSQRPKLVRRDWRGGIHSILDRFRPEGAHVYGGSGVGYGAGI